MHWEMERSGNSLPTATHPRNCPSFPCHVQLLTCKSSFSPAQTPMLLIPAVPEHPETVPASLLLCWSPRDPGTLSNPGKDSAGAARAYSSNSRGLHAASGGRRELNEEAVKYDRNNFGSTKIRTIAHRSTWLGLLHSGGAG